MSTAISARAALLSTIPELRACAISLSGSRDRGDDLVQETLLRAWARLDHFTEGTNMAAWLFTIMRNQFHNEYRRRRFWLEDVDGWHAEQIAVQPGQDGWAISTDLQYALGRLPVHQREAVILVGASGLSPAEAASVCGCKEGTIKSRVSRGRTRLAKLLSDEVGSATESEREGAELVATATRPALDGGAVAISAGC